MVTGNDSGRRAHPRQSLGGVELLCYRASESAAPHLRKNIAGEILDISPGGACLRLLEPMSRGDTLAVEIRDRESGESFRARAQVRWCAVEAGGVSGRHTVGLQFQEIYTPVGRREKFTLGPRLSPGEGNASTARMEKRMAPRFPVDDYVVTCLPRGSLSPAGLKRNFARDVIDLSRKGVRLRVTERLKPGACFRFTLHMNRFGDALEASSEVRWCRPETPPAGTGFVAGFQFLDLPEDKVKMIEFVREHLAARSQKPRA